MSRCFFCRNGQMQPSQTTYVVDLKTGIVVVRNVPCEECDVCGEKVLSDEVVRQLEGIVARAKESASEIYVTDYERNMAKDKVAA